MASILWGMFLKAKLCLLWNVYTVLVTIRSNTQPHHFEAFKLRNTFKGKMILYYLLGNWESVIILAEKCFYMIYLCIIDSALPTEKSRSSFNDVWSPLDQAPVPSLPCALLLEPGSGMQCAGTWLSPDLGSCPALQLSILSLPQSSVHRRPPRSTQWWIQPAVALAACVPHVVFNFILGVLILPTKMATSPREKILYSQSPWAPPCTVLHRDSAVV